MSECLSPFVHLSDGTVGMVDRPGLGAVTLARVQPSCLPASVSLCLCVAAPGVRLRATGGWQQALGVF